MWFPLNPHYIPGRKTNQRGRDVKIADLESQLLHAKAALGKAHEQLQERDSLIRAQEESISEVSTC